MCGIFAFKGQSITTSTLERSFNLIKHRGPDESAIESYEGLFLGFHRLAIMDLSHQGMQPFKGANSERLICNGEIFNYKALTKIVSDSYSFHSGSDCEVILPLIEKIGLTEACQQLDGEFAFVLADTKTGRLQAARDLFGIRPLFYGKTEIDGELAFASEAKALHDFCTEVKPFPPGHLFDGSEFVAFSKFEDGKGIGSLPEESADLTTITRNIGKLLTESVEKRLQADAPIGFLLSGGLDSSLVCALAAKLRDKPIRTFAIGTKTDAIDTHYAQIVADHIGSDHTNVYFDREDILERLEEVIVTLETCDITTIRASIGMFLICEHIRKQTDIKVLLTGEVSDELFGYKYTDYAPSSEAFQEESLKRVTELYYYDVLRADRCISAHSLEARVPFSDNNFAKYVVGIHPEIKLNRYGIGKYLLRRAFADQNLLPESILNREKAAFSDAVGHSMVDDIKAYAEGTISDTELAAAKLSFAEPAPFTKESLLYRRIFEKHYPGRSSLIPDFWMPNQSWSNCKVKDPSARVLPNYGKSGS